MDGVKELEAETIELPGKIYGAHLDVANESVVKTFVDLAFEKLGDANTLIKVLLQKPVEARTPPEGGGGLCSKERKFETLIWGMGNGE